MVGPQELDISEWVERLHAEMAHRQQAYDAEPDVLVKRNMSGGMLAAVILALLKLPSFKNDSVHLPLKDLLIFLSDLDKGRDHRWTAPVNFGGTNIATTAQEELKSWIRAAFSILTTSGFKPVEASRRIARGLTASGRSGRDGGPVRWQRVLAWCREPETPRHLMVKEKAERWWADMQTSIAAINVLDVVTKKEMAGQFADQCWSLPHLRDQSVSLVSDRTA
jgi:hypothetical protein